MLGRSHGAQGSSSLSGVSGCGSWLSVSATRKSHVLVSSHSVLVPDGWTASILSGPLGPPPWRSRLGAAPPWGPVFAPCVWPRLLLSSAGSQGPRLVPGRSAEPSQTWARVSPATSWLNDNPSGPRSLVCKRWLLTEDRGGRGDPDLSAQHLDVRAAQWMVPPHLTVGLWLLPVNAPSLTRALKQDGREAQGAGAGTLHVGGTSPALLRPQKLPAQPG